ncbi:hypothetical protein [Dialister micraerophilus]|uniref:Uncharacterized protein n=1 Tax=Dialister micraerophilus UPII 345-E TaxID=910314 RepID=E4LAB4_9FIRM|nr:hypothetical protein [Dialister micraerophilus]EFR42286.1 hypothetical protein HMPREF9220_0744 [Dialister micraerophilus UPII 345-E]
MYTEKKRQIEEVVDRVMLEIEMDIVERSNRITSGLDIEKMQAIQALKSKLYTKLKEHYNL